MGFLFLEILHSQIWSTFTDLVVQILAGKLKCAAETGYYQTSVLCCGEVTI